MSCLALMPATGSWAAESAPPSANDNGETAQAMQGEGIAARSTDAGETDTTASPKTPAANPANGYPADPRAPTVVPPGGIALAKIFAQRNQTLQDEMNQFPLLQPATDAKGNPAFQTLPLTKPLVINNEEYFGFRFRVPTRKHDEDFVWAFIAPRENRGWYFEPPNGIVYFQPDGILNYFESFFWPPRSNYDIPKTLPPTAGNRLGLQILDGKKISDGETYLIWFNFGPQHAANMSVIFTFASLDPKKPLTALAIERALAIKRKPRAGASAATGKQPTPGLTTTPSPPQSSKAASPAGGRGPEKTDVTSA